jgi:hypothetical protein
MKLIKTLLIIEDNPGDARLIREMLDEDEALQAELFLVGSMNDAEKHLTNQHVSLFCSIWVCLIRKGWTLSNESVPLRPIFRLLC